MNWGRRKLQRREGSSQVGQESIDRLVAPLWLECHALVEQRLELRGCLDPLLCWRRQGCAAKPIRRGYWQCAGQQAIQRGGQGVDIGPRTLPAISLILLERRVALFEDDGKV